jgi:hypothetical protein
VTAATWGRQTEASIQWGDNQFRFLEVPEKTPIFIFFSKNLPPPEICRPRRPPNVKTASAGSIFVSTTVQNNTLPKLHDSGYALTQFFSQDSETAGVTEGVGVRLSSEDSNLSSFWLFPGYLCWGLFINRV